jgi:hypothetical protein
MKMSKGRGGEGRERIRDRAMHLSRMEDRSDTHRHTQTHMDI